MFDFHAHILPDVTGDDGSQSLDMSLDMLRMAVAAGTADIVATPHVNRRGIVASWSEITNELQLLQSAAKHAGLPIRIYAGAEVELNYDALRFLKGKGDVAYCIGGTSYLLCELTEQSQPDQTEKLLFELMLRGYIPVLAHPERYVRIMAHPEQVLQWMKRGVLTQCNVGSFAGAFGDRAQSHAEDLLRNHMITFLGSDAHRTDRRTTDQREGLAAIQRLGGSIEKCAQHAERILSGKYLYPSLPDTWEKRKKGFFSGLFGRKR